MAQNHKRSGLGRGIESLFEDNAVVRDKNLSEMIRISDIEPTRGQPRREFDEESLASLAASITAYGLLQPIIVTENLQFPGTYRIIAGERRWRACRIAGLSEIPCIVFSGDDLTAAEVALVENIQRKDLSPVEEAGAFRDLMDKFGLTQEQVAEKTGRSRPAVANALRLLDLPDEVLRKVSSGTLSAGHARTLLGLRSREDMISLSEEIEKEGYSVRETEKRVRSRNRPAPAPKKPKDEQTAVYLAELERRCMSSAGRRVRIDDGGEGKRRLVIDYSDSADLEELLVKLFGRDVLDG
ncbi:MAG: ParB/RepB/Spo0J family partition protein [Clostridia bacterium]|nr:ParB/RepB/Spo0J family partition protein [Clostridia bacterium]